MTKTVTRNLDKIIDINFYPVPEARKSNMRHRPIGIGVQGLADTFAMMRFPFDGPDAKLLNKQIFETIYHAALEASCEIASKVGHYETYPGSPLSKGILQCVPVAHIALLLTCSHSREDASAPRPCRPPPFTASRDGL